MTKIHHAVIDGMSGAEIMGVLLDLTPEGREAPPIPPDWGKASREPSEFEMLMRGVLAAPRYVERVARALPSTLPNIQDVAFLSQELRRASRSGTWSSPTCLVPSCRCIWPEPN